MARRRQENASAALREGLGLAERREHEQTARLAALRDAAAQGWADVAAGRYDDIADGDLDDFIGQLGEAAARTHPAG